MLRSIKLTRPDLVLLGCPKATASGGPESIHQLAQIINELGVRAEIIYGGSSFKIETIKGVQLLYEFP